MAPNPYLNKYNETAEFGADFRNCHSKNSNPYACLTLQKLKQLGQRYGVTDFEKVKPGVGKERLAKFVEAGYRREHPYMDWGVSDLKQFAKVRKVEGRSKAVRKSAMVDLLEEADKHWVFPHFMDLPPEIRRMVYRFACLQVNAIRRDVTRHHWPSPGPCLAEFEKTHSFTAFGYGEGSLAEPALTRLSRGIRDESLPIFYNIRRFEIDKFEHLVKLVWLPHISAHELASMRRFQLAMVRGFKLNIDLELCDSKNYVCWLTHEIENDSYDDGPGSTKDRVVCKTARKIERLSVDDGFDETALVHLREATDGLTWGFA